VIVLHIQVLYTYGKYAASEKTWMCLAQAAAAQKVHG
jgi:hypothetical protein